MLPQLAVNLGWLRLMGEPRTEQTRRQNAKPNAAVEKAKRREARKSRRGYAGLARAIMAA